MKEEEFDPDCGEDEPHHGANEIDVVQIRFSYVMARIDVVVIGLHFSKDDVSKNELLMLFDGARCGLIRLLACCKL